jgi:hypothetical protein
MTITVDISKLPTHLRRILVDEMLLKHKDGLLVDEDSPSDPRSFTLTNEDNANKMTRRLKDILIKNKIRDYVIVLDPSGKNTIKILERSSVENLGLFHCIHCGMEFEDEMQLSVHHRIHYVI